MNLTPKQEEIRKEAAIRLDANDWFKGSVCLDDFPTDAQIDLNREAVISFICMQTQYCDGSEMIRHKTIPQSQGGYTLTKLIILMFLGVCAIDMVALIRAIVHFILKHW